LMEKILCPKISYFGSKKLLVREHSSSKSNIKVLYSPPKLTSIMVCMVCSLPSANETIFQILRQLFSNFYRLVHVSKRLPMTFLLVECDRKNHAISWSFPLIYASKHYFLKIHSSMEMVTVCLACYGDSRKSHRGGASMDDQKWTNHRPIDLDDYERVMCHHQTYD